MASHGDARASAGIQTSYRYLRLSREASVLACGSLNLAAAMTLFGQLADRVTSCESRKHRQAGLLCVIRRRLIPGVHDPQANEVPGAILSRRMFRMTKQIADCLLPGYLQVLYNVTRPLSVPCSESATPPDW